jgi:hypothetical protein
MGSSFGLLSSSNIKIFFRIELLEAPNIMVKKSLQEREIVSLVSLMSDERAL